MDTGKLTGMEEKLMALKFDFFFHYCKFSFKGA